MVTFNLNQKAINRDKEALKKILKAIDCLAPIVENLGFNGEKPNYLQIASKLPKIMKAVSNNEKILADVFNEKFKAELEELVNENS